MNKNIDLYNMTMENNSFLAKVLGVENNVFADFSDNLKNSETLYISEAEKNAFADFIGNLKASECCSWHNSYTEHGHNW